MKMKKFRIMSLSALMLISAAGCSTSNEAEAPDESTAQEVMVIDSENKEITMLAEVNGKYFTESTRHGVVFKDGSNGEKSVLRGLADEKEFYNRHPRCGQTWRYARSVGYKGWILRTDCRVGRP